MHPSAEFLLITLILPIVIGIESKHFPWEGKIGWNVENIEYPLQCRIFTPLESNELNHAFHCKEFENEINEVSSLLEYGVEITDFYALKSTENLQRIKEIYNHISSSNGEYSLGSILSVITKKNSTIDEYPLLLSHCSSHIQIPIQNLQKTCSFLHTISESIEKKRKERSFEDRIKVFIAGGGPVGLMSAIESYSNGADVEVVEKRLEYSRNTWFDLSPPPWSTTLQNLERWGMRFQNLEYVVHDGVERVITVRNQNLERFLSKITAILNITIHYKMEFIAFCHPEDIQQRKYAVLRNTSIRAPELSELEASVFRDRNSFCNKNLLQSSKMSEEFTYREFDVIVGTEGTSSIVRQMAGIFFQKKSHFEVLQRFTYKSNDIHQSTMLLNFKETNGECPHLKRDQEGELLDARYPSLAMDGITSIWKRFFLTNCQLQVFFMQELGNSVLENYVKAKPERGTPPLFWREKMQKEEVVEPSEWQDSAIPWELIKKITDLLLEDSYSSIEELKKSILRKKANPELYDIDIFNVVIHQAENNTKVLRNSMDSNERLGIVTLSGDASITAHFRLGVGINNAFIALPELGKLVHLLNVIGSSNLKASSPKIDEIYAAVKEKEESATTRAGHLLQFQLSTMFFESYCGYTVFFDQSQKNYWDTPLIYLPEKQKQQFRRLSQQEVLQKCPLLQGY